MNKQNQHNNNNNNLTTTYEASHGSVKSYFIGFLISIVLTIIPFYFVMTHIVSKEFIVVTIIVTAILQLLVQLICFLHMSHESHPRWNLTAFIFTTIVVTILVIGSLWIMWNLNENMMDMVM